MIHRYLAMTVGALILVMAVVSWSHRKRLPFSPWWPTLTLVWVVVQGLFGKYTVTLKLYPLVVTLHLLGGLLLLALLAAQHAAFRQRPLPLACRSAARRVGGAGAAGDADRARRLGQQQLRRAGLHRLSAVQRRLVAGDGLRPWLHAAARPGRGARRHRPDFRRPGGRAHGAPPVRAARHGGAAVAGLAAVARARRGNAGLRRRAGRAHAARSWPAACPTSCSAGRWRRHWGTPPARPGWCCC